MAFCLIRNAELSEVYGYQIFSGLRVPERKKLLCLAVGMSLNIEEVKLIIKRYFNDWENSNYINKEELHRDKTINKIWSIEK